MSTAYAKRHWNAQAQEDGRTELLTQSFPLIGVGASAGGLEAITELLSNMTFDSGVAMLIVQHLEPDHSILLTEILAKKTAIPVVEATENQLIEKNWVYVIPPNTSMTVVNGRLVLKARDSTLAIPCQLTTCFILWRMISMPTPSAFRFREVAPTVLSVCRRLRAKAVLPLLGALPAKRYIRSRCA